MAGHAKVAMPPGGRPCGESPGIAEEGVVYPVVRGVFVFVLVYADAEDVESRLSFHHAAPPAARASTEFRRSYKLSCAILCVSIADPRRFGAGSASSLPPSAPTSWGSSSPFPAGYTPLSDDILRFVPAGRRPCVSTVQHQNCGLTTCYHRLSPAVVVHVFHLAACSVCACIRPMLRRVLVPVDVHPVAPLCPVQCCSYTHAGSQIDSDTMFWSFRTRLRLTHLRSRCAPHPPVPPLVHCPISSPGWVCAGLGCLLRET